ncbi:diiron oxygenase [Calidifontibacter sp. DB0510]|uniref:Diiron oxygenase n=1 Tax=Metallococcus carri TaxID=1656884 RepID=A0A967B064_9MICO|nr:diiron oxygenase [Metallococcus carri]NHN56354.1 diiron oxygenase [Metallococcus carri]NOP35978.1 diiron oxygenase [Calidifontibacter sp. DB2511S]
MTATITRSTATETVGEHAQAGQTYFERLETLSEASVHQHFDAFLDIDWDHPDYAIDPKDPRWKLPEVDVLGRTQWYQSLPEDEQLRVGLYRQANVTKVGLQFEQILISGLMYHSFGLPNGSPEFRYATHEATEECHHTQMFQQFVNRSLQDVGGGTKFFQLAGPLLPIAARIAPVLFFYGVLAGEEPIDHVQKSVLRSSSTMHPLLQRIMQIHVAEEARHIGFAHQFLEERSPALSRRDRALLSVLVPIIMRWLCDEILVPSKEARRAMGLPDDVAKQIFWRDPESQKFLRDLFGDVRMLAERTGLMNPLARRVWRAMGIDGRPSRFRSEPASAAA